MSDEITEIETLENDNNNNKGYKPATRFDASAVHHLSGMYQTWFLDYASYVILERAVPHIEDGLKPVQRRILHSMKRMDDGRYNKVANIVGHTMQFHPHGDASIGDALVQMGQKDLLIDCQGNWGNILTGSRAAAPRYIEARLSKFALETVFNQKTTEWQLSYDGRNKEPITLPVKFPLLLAQGAEGIAVGLSSKILPHNFNELCDAAVSCLRGEEYHLYPDFPTGGSIDVSKYNDGQRGGKVRVRARIEKVDQKTLVIRDIPFSKTSETLIASITSAIEKGKIKARKVEDLTAAEVEILVHLAPGVSSDKTLDALYAFTDCEVSLSPNCCVIQNDKPVFATVSDVLSYSAEQTKDLIRQELEIRKGELMEQLFFASLEKIFIEERIYKDKKYENAPTLDAACEHIDNRLREFVVIMPAVAAEGKLLIYRDICRDDILRLMEIKMKRILKFNKDKADELMANIQAEIADIERDLANLTEVACNWFLYLKKKYGAEHPRLTEIRSFENIDAVRVVEANEKLYINRQEGFVGTSLKKDEFVCNCSNLDDIIIFYKDGKYKIVKVQEKMFIGKNVLHVQVQKRNDTRTIYNVVYRDGKAGNYYVKRFNVTSFTRDNEYNLTKGTPGSKVCYFTANPNGEAEVIKLTLEPGPKVKKLFVEFNFSTLAVKGRTAGGNILSKNPVHRISLKSRGHSTLEGRDVWYDPDVNRINYDEHGRYLGKFNEDDSILVILTNGDFYITNFDLNNHYEPNILRIEKLDVKKAWTLLFHNGEQQGQVYMKRFRMDLATKKHQNMLGHEKSSIALLTDTPYPCVTLEFENNDVLYHDPMTVECEPFIDIKVAGFKSKGRRVAVWPVVSIVENAPVMLPEELQPVAEGDAADTAALEAVEAENLDPDAGKTEQEVEDEITGQLSFKFEE